SLSEIYASIREEEAIQSRGMEDVLERGQEIRDRLRELSSDLKAERQFDWSKRREGREILKRQIELQEKIRESADQLDRTLERLEQNRITSQEIGEKMEEIHRLLRQIESEDLRRAMENFGRMLDEVSERDLISAMERMEMEAEDIVERLDRTIDLLKQVLEEEKMEELVRRMEEMLEEQRALRDSTASGDKGDLSRRQERLGDEFELYESDLSDFSGGEGDSALTSRMEEMLEEMSDEQIDEMMRKAADEIKGGDKEEAQCTQSKIINDMLSLYTSLCRCRNTMKLTLEREVIERIERSARELVEVSKLEEGFIPGLGSRRGPGWRESLVAEQLVLKEAARRITDDLLDIGRKTMAISGAVFVHLGVALREIDAVLSGVEEGKLAASASAAERVYCQLNMAVIELLRSKTAPGSSSGGARRRMQMMLDNQLSIDEQLKHMLEQGSVVGLSVEDRARMSRLAAEQRKLRELLEQIVSESKGTSDLLGRMDDMVGEMEEV
ncbi:MAG: hypothetical protein KAX38_05240, partial [Candidatus Krumholzibacteria bacterium]|nr:hypothetical protein [Candidatus Krumholzibacteria bacterium]